VFGQSRRPPQVDHPILEGTHLVVIDQVKTSNFAKKQEERKKEI